MKCLSTIFPGLNMWSWEYFLWALYFSQSHRENFYTLLCSQSRYIFQTFNKWPKGTDQDQIHYTETCPLCPRFCKCSGVVKVSQYLQCSQWCTREWRGSCLSSYPELPNPDYPLSTLGHLRTALTAALTTGHTDQTQASGFLYYRGTTHSSLATASHWQLPTFVL